MITVYRVDHPAYTFDGDNTFIENLSKVNIFVGGNNSGKSRLLRYLFSIEKDQFLIDEINLMEVNHFIESLKSKLQKCITSPNSSVVDVNGVLNDVNQLNLLVWITKGEPFLKPLSQLIDKLQGIATIPTGSSPDISTRAMMSNPNALWQQIQPTFNALTQEYKDMFQQIQSKLDKDVIEFQKMYIPTLRGLRGMPIQDKDRFKDFYAIRTVKDYFLADTERVPESDYTRFNIFTGLTLYDEVTDLLLGDMQERRIVTEFQNFLSESFFDGAEVVLIPKRKHDVLNVRIGNEEKPIYDLGDGIQSIIVMTFPMFRYEAQNMLFFIEEPEQYLHPGMQRKFLQTLFRFDKHQFFITTHSNHLLDLTLDFSKVSVYKFTKNVTEDEEPNFAVENVSNEDTSVLELLGVQKSSVMLSNCTIWVEGITDRLYLRRYFDLYQKYVNGGEAPFKEDIHFSFVEYGGGNITHWSFLDEESSDSDTRGINVDRLCSRLFLIVDSDGGKKGGRMERLQQKLGDTFYCLPCREVENLISAKVLKCVIASYEGLSVEQVEFHNPQFTEKDYAKEYLGKFIEEQLVTKLRKGSYMADSGTVSRKTDFCRRALNYIRHYEDMSTSAIQLCKKLYNFVRSCNRDVAAKAPQE